jgi:hypothetical protein
MKHIQGRLTIPEKVLSLSATSFQVEWFINYVAIIHYHF